MKMKLLLTLILVQTACSVFSQSTEIQKKERIAIEQHGSAFLPFAVIAGEDALENLKMKYHIDSEQLPALYRMLIKRETRKLAHNYIETDSRSRIIAKASIDSVYQDSVNAILIPLNLNISGTCISMTLRFAEKIRLSEKKRKKLLDCALDYARRLRRNPYESFAREEMTVLNKYLTRNQLNYVLDEKNKVEASVKAQRAWNELDMAGETQGLDSTQQVIRANMYYSLEMRFRDLYVGESELLERNLSDLYVSKPKIIKMYEALEERKRMKAKDTRKEKNVSSAFSW